MHEQDLDPQPVAADVPTEGSITAEGGSYAGMSEERGALDTGAATNSDPGPLPQVERGELQLQNDATAAAAGRPYTVADGDSLQTLALRFYGSALEWERIYDANTDRLSNPDHLYPGQELVIPEPAPASPA